MWLCGVGRESVSVLESLDDPAADRGHRPRPLVVLVEELLDDIDLAVSRLVGQRGSDRVVALPGGSESDMEIVSSRGTVRAV